MAVEAFELRGTPEFVLHRQREIILRPSFKDRYLKGQACLVGASLLRKIVDEPSLRSKVASYLVARDFDPYDFAQSHGATDQQLSDIENALQGMTPEGSIGLSAVALPGILKMKAEGLREPKKDEGPKESDKIREYLRRRDAGPKSKYVPDKEHVTTSGAVVRLYKSVSAASLEKDMAEAI